MHYNFDLDLKFGLEAENLLQEILHNKKIEVKCDLLVGKTRNVAIEYSCFGRPSGIATTKADYWCIIFDGKMYNKNIMVLIETEYLKKIARKNLNNTVYGGDNKSSKMVLIPIDELLISPIKENI